MNKLLPILSIIVFYILFPVNGFSQNNNWEEHYSDNNVKIEYKYIVCNFSSTANQELIIFKFTNLSNSSLTLTYETRMWYNDELVNTEQNRDEFRKTIQIDQNETIITDCKNKWNEYNIFSAFIENETEVRYPYLTKFKLHNLTTENE